MRLATLPLALALTACVTSRPAPAPASAALTFIEDDFPKALALARERKLPLFVDGWAPW